MNPEDQHRILNLRSEHGDFDVNDELTIELVNDIATLYDEEHKPVFSCGRGELAALHNALNDLDNHEPQPLQQPKPL